MTKAKTAKQTKGTRKNTNIVMSISTAFRGAIFVWRSEGSVRLIITTGLVFTAAAIGLRCSLMEILLIAFVWIQVTTGEIFNTSLEKAMDYACDKEYHPIIKKGKDLAAASVLIISCFAWLFSILVIARQWLQT